MSTSTDKRQTGPQAAFCLAASFGCGIVASRLSPASPLLLVIVFAAAAAMTLLLMLLGRDSLSAAALLVSFAAAGAYDGALALSTPGDSITGLLAAGGPAPAGGVMRFEGAIAGRTGRDVYGDRKVFRYVLRLNRVEIAGRPRGVSGKALLDAADDLPYGSVVQGVAFFDLPRAAANPGQFDYRANLANAGISCRARADAPGAVRVTSKPRLFSVGRIFAAMRQALLQKMETLGLDRQGVIPAVLLGDRSALPDTTREAFVRSGTMHLLSVSGLHLVIVAGFFLWFLRFFGVSMKISSAVTMAVAICYTLIVGPQPPVVRSAIMLGFFCFGIITDRPTRALSVVSTTALAMLVFAPLQIYDVGFQMSFAAVLGLFYLGGPLAGYFADQVSRMRLPLPGLVREIANMFGVSVGAGAAVAPLGLYHFGVVSLVSPLANLVLIPTTWVMMVTGFAAAGLSFASVKLAGLAALPAAGAEASLVAIAGLFSRVPLAYVYVSAPLWITAAMYAYLVALSVAAARGKGLAQVLIAGLAAANALAWPALLPTRERPPEVVTLEDGRGAAVAVLDGKGRTVIFVGRRGSADTGRDLISPFLLSRGISTISLLVETAGADARIRDVLSERFMLRNVVRQRKFLGSPDFDGLPRPTAAACDVSPGDTVRLSHGLEITFHGGRPIDFLGPPEPWHEGLIADVRLSGRRAVIAADVTGGCLAVTRGKIEPRADVLCALNCGGAQDMLGAWEKGLAPKTILRTPSVKPSEGGSVSVTLADEPVVRRFRP